MVSDTTQSHASHDHVWAVNKIGGTYKAPTQKLIKFLHKQAVVRTPGHCQTVTSVIVEITIHSIVATYNNY